MNVECQVEKNPHLRHVSSGITFGVAFSFPLTQLFLFLKLTYKHHFSSPVMILDKNGRCCFTAVRCRCNNAAHMVTREFLLFWESLWGNQQPTFYVYPSLARCSTIAVWENPSCSANSRVVWRLFSSRSSTKRSSSNSDGRPEREASSRSKFQFLNLLNQCRAVRSATKPSPYKALMFWAAWVAFIP